MSDEGKIRDDPPNIISLDFGQQPELKGNDVTPRLELMVLLCGIQACVEVLLNIHVAQRFPAGGTARDEYRSHLKEQIQASALHHMNQLRHRT